MNLKVEHLMEDMDNLKTALVNCMEHMWQVWQQEDLLGWQPKPMSTGMYTSTLIFMPKKFNAVNVILKKNKLLFFLQHQCFKLPAYWILC